MNSSNSTLGASPPIAHPTQSFVVLLADGTRHRVACRDFAAQLRQERSGQLKRLRQARAEAFASAADGASNARIRRDFEAKEREMDAAIRRLSKRVRLKPESRRRSQGKQKSKLKLRGTGHGGLVLAKRGSTMSGLARRDRMGREGIMLRIRYVRAGGKHAQPGCLRRHWYYIVREAAVTLDADDRPIVLSNLGDTIDEVADGLAVQEKVLRALRKNAKLGFRMVGAFPYGLPADARRQVLQRIGDEVFGVRGLPWSAAAHDADPEAAVDNPHFHLDYGLLPMSRCDDGSFIISNDLRTDLDGEEGLRFIRHMVAQVLTGVAQEHGLERTFTALSYRERGMDREGGEHVGQEGTAAHRRGEHVASIARNEVRQRRDEARERGRKAEQRLNALELLKRAITKNAECPSLEKTTVEFAVNASAPLAAIPFMTDALGLIDTQSSKPALNLPSHDEPLFEFPPATVPLLSFDKVNLSFCTPDIPAISQSLPSISGISNRVIPIAASPLFSPIAAFIPITAKPPKLAKLGKIAPNVSQLDKLYNRTTLGQQVDVLPVATVLPLVTDQAIIEMGTSPRMAVTPALTDAPVLADTLAFGSSPRVQTMNILSIANLNTEALSSSFNPTIYFTDRLEVVSPGSPLPSITDLRGVLGPFPNSPALWEITAICRQAGMSPTFVYYGNMAPRMPLGDALNITSAPVQRVHDLPSVEVLPLVMAPADFKMGISVMMTVIPAVTNTSTVTDTLGVGVVPLVTMLDIAPIASFGTELPRFSDSPAIYFAHEPEVAIPTSSIPLKDVVGSTAEPFPASPAMWGLGAISPKYAMSPAVSDLGDTALRIPRANSLHTLGHAQRVDYLPTVAVLPFVTAEEEFELGTSAMAVTPGVTDAPTVTDAFSVDTAPFVPTLGVSLIAAFDAEEPKVSVAPAIYVTDEPEVDVPIAPSPSLSDLRGTAVPSPASLSLWRLQTICPRFEKTSALINLENTTPRVSEAPALCFDLAATPKITAPPPMAEFDKHFTTVRASPALRRIGKKSRRVAVPGFDVWEVGAAIAADTLDEATEVDLREAIEREAGRGRRSAAANNLGLSENPTVSASGEGGSVGRALDQSANSGSTLHSSAHGHAAAGTDPGRM